MPQGIVRESARVRLCPLRQRLKDGHKCRNHRARAPGCGRHLCARLTASFALKQWLVCQGHSTAASSIACSNLAGAQQVFRTGWVPSTPTTNSVADKPLHATVGFFLHEFAPQFVDFGLFFGPTRCRWPQPP